MFFLHRPHNDSFGEKIARNAFWLTTGDVVSRFLKLILIALATRTLTVSDFGILTLSFNILALTFVAGDLGISNVLYRKFAEREDRLYLAASFFITLALLGLSVIITLITASMNAPSVALVVLILVFMRFFDALKSLFLTIHTAQNRMEIFTFANIIESAITVMFGFLVLKFSPDISLLAFAYVLGAFITFIYVLFSIKKHLKHLFIRVKTDLMSEIFMAGWPLALGSVAWGLIYTIDSLLLKWMTDFESVGYYNAALKIIQFVSPFGAIVVGASFPSLVATITDPEKHRKLFRRLNELLFSLAAPIALGGIAIAAPILNTLYGAQYIKAAPAFMILLIGLIVGGINYLLIQFMFVRSEQLRSFFYVLGAFVATLVTGLIVIPFLGIQGAAIANLMGQIVIFISHALFLLRVYHLPTISREFIKPALASFIMFITLLISGLTHQAIYISIPAGALIYFVALYLLAPTLTQDIKSIFLKNRE